MAINHKISVIAASYLGEYEGCASNREQKFCRAVDSFLKQTHPNKELIIVSDGCEKTNIIVQTKYAKIPEIRLFRKSKQPLFSGKIRQMGLQVATGVITCYLDVDDFLGVNHLSSINAGFGDNLDADWVYYNDFIYKGANSNPNTIPKMVSLEHGSIGTSSIAHLTNLRDKGLSWSGCDGYGHDFELVQQLIRNHRRFKKIYGCAYNICHIPNLLDV